MARKMTRREREEIWTSEELRRIHRALLFGGIQATLWLADRGVIDRGAAFEDAQLKFIELESLYD